MHRENSNTYVLTWSALQHQGWLAECTLRDRHRTDPTFEVGAHRRCRAVVGSSEQVYAYEHEACMSISRQADSGR